MDRGTKKSLAAIGGLCAASMILGGLIAKPFIPPKEVEVFMPRAYYYPMESVYAEEQVEVIAELPEKANDLKELGEFKLTAYCNCEICCGQWAGGPTASGTEPTAGRTIAVDPEVIPLGSTVYIDGFAYTAEDTGSAIKGKRIDLYLPTHEAALEFGVQYANVSIIKN